MQGFAGWIVGQRVNICHAVRLGGADRGKRVIPSKLRFGEVGDSRG